MDISKLDYKKVKAAARVINNPALRAFLEEGIDIAFDTGKVNQLRHALNIHTYPVHVEEFLFSKHFLSRPKSELYPAVVDELIEINENRGRLVNCVTQGVFTGGIGSAKTTTALYVNAYQLYLVSCYKSPHAMFQMDSTSELLFIFQSMNAALAADVDYTRFRAIIEQSYYFNTVYPYKKDIKSALIFPNRVEAKPMTSDGGAIGQNVLGGIIDEVDFMEVVQNSKKGNGGQGGVYDQAKVIYESISRRIKSRFVNNGGQPGILCLVSSKNYPGALTDRIQEAAATDPTIYVYDKRVWDIKPAGTYGGERFLVFAGDEVTRPKIINTAEDVPVEKRHLIVSVPVEHRGQFDGDIIGALRDIAGVATMARFPFILNHERVLKGFGTHLSILNKQQHCFGGVAVGTDTSPLKVIRNRIYRPDLPRWVHIDLGVTGDAAGVSMGTVKGFKMTEAGNVEEVMPDYHYDFTLRVVPPQGDEIKFFMIREFVYKLKDVFGINVRWVSFDSFQSVDSMQLFRQKGYTTGYISMDTSMLPHEMMKSAFLDGRIASPEHDVAQKEYLTLEKDAIKKKIDHPPNGSKDCADAMTGVAYGLAMRREIWGMYSIPLVRVPESIRIAQEASQVKSETPKAA
ncbi:hypothetical protein WK13_34520 [Burkholderia ubonensis]|uniref:hypothetical protein n=1 Tax=Burkholderia ubonensis TaxID=101571 RepID=UPI000752C984|nr:hypothetical protein [Burkholderia ubonensis]KVR21654.1 hypothetical protein WK13_34520 [Burkholderia ubonensis]